MPAAPRPSARGDLVPSAILGLLGTRGPTSRADVARALDVSPASVTQLTKNLIARGLVVELDHAPSQGGRPGRRLGLVRSAGGAIGAKVTADHVAIVDVDLDGTVRSSTTHPFDPDAPNALDALGHILGSAVDDHVGHLLGVGASQPDRLVVEAALGGAEREHLDVALYTGTPHEVLRAFGDEVGRAEELPDWVFRLWASGNEWNTQAIVMARMDAHRDLDIPVGAVVIEAWSDEEGITIFRDARYVVNADGAPHVAGDFTYPAEGAWPDPKAMIDELHARGIKVILWQIPLQKTEFELDSDVSAGSQVLADGRAMVEGGHAVCEADGSPYHNRGWWFPQAFMVDLSTQRSRDWWTAKRRYLVADLDVDGFKTDGGEHAWGHDLRYGDGRRGDEGNNLYPVHYARAFGDLLRSQAKAPVTFSRAGFTGSQAHGIFWAGDEDSTWEAFRHSVTAGITASACWVVYWGWDLAGFSGPVPDSELYLRAAAAATFMPVMQYPSEFNHHR